MHVVVVVVVAAAVGGGVRCFVCYREQDHPSTHWAPSDCYRYRSPINFFFFFFFWGGRGVVLLVLSMQAKDIYYIRFEECYNQYSLICLIISRLIY